jgi:hypothetical protein
MSKYVYIVSAMTDSISYCFYADPVNEKDTPALREKITIRGGRGLPSQRSGFGEQSHDVQGMPLWTADGIVTRITEEQYSRLKEHPLAKRHLAAKRLTMVSEDVTGNHKKVRQITRDMEGPDGHSLLNKSTVKQRINKNIKVAEDNDANRV